MGKSLASLQIMLKYKHMDEMREIQEWRKPPNPETQARHKKQFRIQVLLPLALFLILCLGITAALYYFKIGSVEQWSHIASIMLIVFWMILGLILLVVLVALVFLVTKLLQLIPPYTRRAQEGIETVKQQVEAGADITVKPVLKIQSFLAVINALRGRR